MALYDFHRKNLSRAQEERGRFKKERDELLLGMGDCIEVKEQRDQLLEGIEAHRAELAHGLTANHDLADKQLHTLADQIKGKGTDSASRPDAPSVTDQSSSKEGGDAHVRATNHRRGEKQAGLQATRGGSDQVDGVAPRQLPNCWEGREKDGDTWRLRIENDSFDGVTETVVVDGACTENGEEDAFLATPTPGVAREMARALTAYADAVEKANQDQPSLTSEASS